MARNDSRPKRRTKISGQFTWRLREMLESPAYRLLSLSAHRVMSRLEIEISAHAGTENGRLPVTHKQFAEYGIDPHSIAPAIRELVALGFVEVTEEGRAGNAEWRAPNLFRITWRPTDTANATDEWKRITTFDEAARRVRQARAPRKNPSGGKRTLSVGETHSENGEVPVGETLTTGAMRETHTTSISGGSTSTGIADFSV